MNRLLCIGYGYSAAATARLLLARGGWQVMGSTRSAQAMDDIAATGVVPLLWGPEVAEAIPTASHILISVAPGEGADPTLAAFGAALATARPRWVGYLSTTAVYGDHGGAWVDETTALTPSTMRGRARVAAEQAWAGLDLPLHIFRLAGIYGPGRGPFEKVRDGSARRILKPGQVFSRIHVDDIAGVLAASIAHPLPGAVYNVCDDDPAPPEDVLAYAAHLLGLPLPRGIPFETAEMTPFARSFYAENKRVRNDRIKRDLAYMLKYPDYRAGLQALLAGL